jgi:hypothetical protein
MQFIPRLTEMQHKEQQHKEEEEGKNTHTPLHITHNKQHFI